MNQNNIIIENYGSYDTTDILYIETGTTTSGTSWSGGLCKLLLAQLQ